MKLASAIIATAILAGACSTPAPSVETIRLLTHDGFVLPQESLDAYTERTGVRVAVLREPDPAAIVDLLVRTKDRPVADVVLGIDSLSVDRVIGNGLVTPHRPIEGNRLDPSLLVDDSRLVPVSTLDVCLNIDAELYRPDPLSPEELAFIEAAQEALPEGAEVAVPEAEDPVETAPRSILDLTDPRFAHQLVVPAPRTSRMGQYFMVSLWQRFGDDPTAGQSWTTVLRDLAANGMEITDTWRDAYFGEFTQGNANGTRSAVVASAGMPVVTARLRHDEPELLETEVIDDGCVRIVNYAGIVAGAADRRDAGRLIDTMVTPEFQFFLGDALGSKPARADLIVHELDELYAQPVEVAPIDPSVDDELVNHLMAQWDGVLVDLEAEQTQSTDPDAGSVLDDSEPTTGGQP